VRLEAQANGDGISIAVRDRGIGIGEEDRPRIFDKFYRGGGELSREVKGVGLGPEPRPPHRLRAWRNDRRGEPPGEGSTFTIRLKAPRPLTRILLVEDEPSLAAGVRDDLQAEGYTGRPRSSTDRLPPIGARRDSTT
jgi:hypothetical protein